MYISFSSSVGSGPYFVETEYSGPECTGSALKTESVLQNQCTVTKVLSGNTVPFYEYFNCYSIETIPVSTSDSSASVLSPAGVIGILS